MTIEIGIVLALLVGIISALAFTRIAADAVLIAALAVLLVVPVPGGQGPGGHQPGQQGWQLGIIDTQTALSGFSNPGMATVALLFIVVAGLRETGAIDWIAERALGRPRTVRGALARMILPVSGMSVFLNNTPVVAMMIPAVSGWAKKLGVAPSKLMIPLSYAAIVGGTCSLIGTSTNLVVAGLVTARTDLPALGMFDIAWVGLPCALLALGTMVVVGPLLLPSRGSVTNTLADPREYALELIVPGDSPLAGKTIERAGLRNIPGGYLIEIDRDGQAILAPGPEQVLLSGDRLIFTGVVETIRDLQNLRGLAPASDQVFKLEHPRYRSRLYEAVVGPSCAILGKTIRQGRFRTTYGGAVIAVARNGQRLLGKVGDIELREGDTLLIEAPPSFAEQQRDRRDFLLISRLDDSTPRRHSRAPIALGILLAMIAAATFGWLSMLVAALLASCVMVLMRCCTISEARQNVDWSVLIVIAAALALGKALDDTGSASFIAGSILSVVPRHPWLVLLAIYAVTSLLTEVITNNAAVALIFPIAQSAAASLGVGFMPFVIAIMMAGSASFATPLGYQTNLMVYGPGGYTFADFLRAGIPMNLLMGIGAVTLCPLFFPF